MPRASRYLREGYTYHLTHRCHDRRFLLKFARDRDAYRKWLRESAKRPPVLKLWRTGYGADGINGSHIHIGAHVDDRERIGLMMHLAAGSYAQQWNRRKGRPASGEANFLTLDELKKLKSA